MSTRRLIPAALLALAAAVAGSAPAVGAVFPRGVMHGGVTSQGNHVTVEVNPSGTRVTRVYVLWESTCVRGPAGTDATPTTGAWESEATNFPIARRTGRWGGARASRPIPQEGFRRTYTTVLSGRVAGGRATATVRLRVVERTSDGATIVRTCTSGPIRFSAPERHVFAGFTTGQREAIIVEMNATRRRVARLRWGWSASCVAGPAVRPDTVLTTFWQDAITGFPVDAGGRWGMDGSFDPVADPATGITTQFAYRIVAVRVGQAMRGSIASTQIDTDTATGQVIRTCASGPVRFRIRD